MAEGTEHCNRNVPEVTVRRRPEQPREMKMKKNALILWVTRGGRRGGLNGEIGTVRTAGTSAVVVVAVAVVLVVVSRRRGWDCVCIFQLVHPARLDGKTSWLNGTNREKKKKGKRHNNAMADEFATVNTAI